MDSQSVHSQEFAPDEISVKGTFLKIGRGRKYLMSKWKVILLGILLGGIAGIVYATIRTTNYTAQTTFVLEDSEKGGSSLGQYSSLASMVGIDVSSGGGLFQGDNIIELYKSRLMIEKTLLSPAIFNGHSQLLIDRYIQINKLREAWKNNTRLRNVRFNLPKGNYTFDHDSIIGRIVDDINTNYLSVSKPDKKLTIVSVKVKARDPFFAKAFTENIVATVNAFYIQTKTKGIVHNLALLQHQADSVRAALNSSIGGTAAAMDMNPNPNPALQILKVPSQRRQIDVQASGAMYGEVIKNLEVAKSSLQRETPLIQVIDQPILPLPNDRLGRFKAMLTGMFAGFMVSLGWVLISKVYLKIMN